MEQAKAQGTSAVGDENALRQQLEKLQGDLKYVLVR